MKSLSSAWYRNGDPLGVACCLCRNGKNANLGYKIDCRTFILSLILTAASAGEWEVFTGTLTEYEKYDATQNTVEFKNGIEVSGRDELFEKPVIKNKISFGGTSKHVDPEIVDLASELMLEGYSDFILKSSVFGGKSLLAIKGRQQTKLGLSSDYSVIRAETRLDKNNDGKFERSEIISEYAQESLKQKH